MNTRSFTYVLLTILLASLTITVVSFSGGPPTGRTGAPGETTCQAGCHSSFALNSGPGNVGITSTIPETGYVPGETYTLTFNVSQNGIAKYGFESMVYNASLNGSAGTLALKNSETQLKEDGNRSYVQHTAGGNAQNEWMVDWTAPESGTGDVEVYAAFVAANGIGGNSGDHVYTTSLPVSEGIVSSLDEVTAARALQIRDLGHILEVQFELPQSGNAEMELINMNGQRTWSSSAFLQQHVYTSQIDKSALTNGVYVLVAKTKGRVLSRKIIIR